MQCRECAPDTGKHPASITYHMQGNGIQGVTMSTDKIANMIKREFYPNLDRLSEEFVFILNEHPEIRQTKIVSSALENYIKKLEEVSSESILSWCIGMREAERAHESLNNAAMYALGHIKVTV